jgi:multidrug resistance protein, MATE family
MIKTPHFVNFKAAVHKTLHLSLPIVASRISVNMGGFISMIMIAHLGHAELAAGALINSVMLSVMVPLWSFFFAVSAVTGHKFGAKKYHEIGKVMRQGVLLAITIGLPTILLLRHIGTILIFFDQDYHLSALTQDFYRAYSWGVIPSLCGGCLGQFFLSVGKQKTSLIFTLVSSTLTIIFGYTLIFGHFGMPAFGVQGMGYSNALTSIIMLLIVLATMLISPTCKPYKLFEFINKADFHYAREIFTIGWPIALMSAGELIIFAISIIFFGWIGESALAAQQITMQLNIMAFMIPQGLGQSTTILVSQELGAKKYSSVRDLGYAAALIGVVAALLVLIFYALTYKYLLGIYLNFSSSLVSSTVKLAIPLLMLAGFMNVIDYPRFILVCSLRGLRDTVGPMFIFVGLGSILSLPTSYLLAFVLHFGALGIPWGFIIGFTVGSVILLRRFYVILLRRFYRLTDANYLRERFY